MTTDAVISGHQWSFLMKSSSLSVLRTPGPDPNPEPTGKHRWAQWTPFGQITQFDPDYQIIRAGYDLF